MTGLPGERRAFLSYVHSLRGLAILAVVAVHVADLAGFGESPAVFEHVIYSLFGNATVFFVFVSGFLFRHLADRFNYSDYLARRFSRVVLPYVAISLPVLLRQYWRHDDVFATPAVNMPFVRGLHALATGAHMNVPFWFVPMIVLFIILAPAFLAIDRRPRRYVVILPLLVLAMFLHRSRAHRLVWQSSLYFLPVYLTGMWASANREAVLDKVRRYRWPLFGAAFALWLAQFAIAGRGGPVFSRQPFSIESGIVDLDLPAKLLATFLLLDLLRRYDLQLGRRLAPLAAASYGIFFVHGYLLLLLQLYMRRTFAVSRHFGTGTWAIATLGIVAISMLAIRVAQQLLGDYSGYLIGCEPARAPAIGPRMQRPS